MQTKSKTFQEDKLGDHRPTPKGVRVVSIPSAKGPVRAHQGEDIVNKSGGDGRLARLRTKHLRLFKQLREPQVPISVHTLPQTRIASSTGSEVQTLMEVADFLRASGDTEAALE